MNSTNIDKGLQGEAQQSFWDSKFSEKGAKGGGRGGRGEGGALDGRKLCAEVAFEWRQRS